VGHQREKQPEPLRDIISEYPTSIYIESGIDVTGLELITSDADLLIFILRAESKLIQAAAQIGKRNNPVCIYMSMYVDSI
jgi:hypothetical protein